MGSSFTLHFAYNLMIEDLNWYFFKNKDGKEEMDMEEKTFRTRFIVWMGYNMIVKLG